MPDPKPCPVCEESNEHVEFEHTSGGMSVRVTCSCGTCGPWETTMDNAADAWNALYRVQKVVEVDPDDCFCPTASKGACQVGPCNPGEGFKDCPIGMGSSAAWCPLPILIKAKEVT